jgi:ADP-dependent phosphofructokinase/glucokinase
MMKNKKLNYFIVATLIGLVSSVGLYAKEVNVQQGSDPVPTLKKMKAIWKEVGQNTSEGVTIYIDDLNIQQIADVSRVRALYNFHKTNNDLNKPHLSEVEYLEFQCKTHQLKLGQVEWYAKRYAKGKKVWTTQNLKWQATEHGSAYERIEQRACQVSPNGNKPL